MFSPLPSTTPSPLAQRWDISPHIKESTPSEPVDNADRVRQPRDVAVTLMMQMDERMLSEVRAEFGASGKVSHDEFARIVESMLNPRPTLASLDVNRRSGGLFPSMSSTRDVKKSLRASDEHFAKQLRESISALTAGEDFAEGVRAMCTAMDYEDSGWIRWDRFTSFLADAAQHGRVGIATDAPKAQFHPAERVRTFSVSESGNVAAHACFVPSRQAFLVLVGRRYATLVDPTTQQAIGQPFVPRDMSLTCDLLATAFATEHNEVALASSDMRVVTVAVDTGRQIRSMRLGSSCVMLAWVGGRTHMLWGGTRDGFLLGFDLSTKGVMNHTASVRLGTNSVGALCAIPHFNQLAVSCDTNVFICCASSGALKLKPMHSPSTPTSLVFHPDTSALIVGARDAKIRVWSLGAARGATSTSKSGAKNTFFELVDTGANGSTTHPEHSGSIVGLCAVPTVGDLFSLDSRGLLKHWNIRSYQCVQSLPACTAGKRFHGGETKLPQSSQHHHEPATFTTVAHSPADKGCIFVGCRFGYVCLARSEQSELSPSNMPFTTGPGDEGHEKCVSDTSVPCGLVVCSDDNTITVVSEENVRVWSVRHGSLLSKYDSVFRPRMASPIHSAPSTTCACPLRTKQFLALGRDDGSIGVVCVATGGIRWVADVCAGSEITCIQYCSKFNIIFAVTYSGKLFAVQDDGKRVTRLFGDTKVSSVLFSAHHDVLLVGGINNAITVAHVQSAVPVTLGTLFTIPPDGGNGRKAGGEVFALCSTPSSSVTTLFAAADASGTIRVVDFATCEVTARFTPSFGEQRSSEVTAMEFSSHALIVGNHSGYVAAFASAELQSAASTDAVDSLWCRRLHRASVTAFQVIDWCNTLVTAGSDMKVCVWCLTTGDSLGWFDSLKPVAPRVQLALSSWNPSPLSIAKRTDQNSSMSPTPRRDGPDFFMTATDYSEPRYSSLNSSLRIDNSPGSKMGQPPGMGSVVANVRKVLAAKRALSAPHTRQASEPKSPSPRHRGIVRSIHSAKAQRANNVSFLPRLAPSAPAVLPGGQSRNAPTVRPESRSLLAQLPPTRPLVLTRVGDNVHHKLGTVHRL